MATMKGALVARYVDGAIPDDVVCLADVPRPLLELKQQLLVRVLACSLAAGDVHLLRGRVKLVLHPPAFPYVPGMDVCGRVEAITPSVVGFSVGDIVVASNGALPVGGMAEYMLVHPAYAAHKPPGVPPLLAACCPTSATTAYRFVRDVACVSDGERVLVLGGAGGVGSAAVQLAKAAGASFVAATSTQAALLRSLGADDVIDYTAANWWESRDFIEQPFDVILDCVGGGDHYHRAASSGCLKSRWSGGRFVAVVGGEPSPVVQTVPQLAAFAAGMLWRPLWTLAAPWMPAYRVAVSTADAGATAAVLDLVATLRLRVVLDAAAPTGFPFTAAGVAAALRLQASGHAHGKVVVDVAGAGATAAIPPVVVAPVPRSLPVPERPAEE